MAIIQGTNGNDDLLSGRNADYLDGGAGDDTLTGNAGSDTLDGGKGNDELEGGSGADTFVYALGYGNDTITDYEEEDVIQFTEGTPTITTKGNNVIFTVGSGSKKGTLTVLNAKKNGTIITYEDSDGIVHEYPQTVIATKTKATLTEDYNKDSFSIVEYSKDHDNNYDNVKTIDASKVEQDIHVIGNVKANAITGSENNDTIEGGKGNDTLTGGNGADVFVWNKGDGDDVITDYNNEDELLIVGDTVKNITKSGNDYVVNLASKKTITLVDGANKIVSYTDDKDVHIYPDVFTTNEAGTAVSLKAEYSADAFDVKDYAAFGETARTIDAAAVDQDLSIVGNKKNNVIIGADGNNTIEGGKGNDTLTGGTGKNVFVFNAGDGKDVITNYSSGDVIKVTSGTISASKSGSNYVLSFSGGGQVTLQNASKKYIKVVDDNGLRYVPANPLKKLTYTDENDGTVTINKGYTDDTFDVNEFESDFAGPVFDIKATGVAQDINIIGNKKANNIIGSKNNDTIEGGKGNDTLTGGDGADVFVWNKGDGNDVITDYNNEDELLIKGDTVKNITKSGKNFVVNLTSKSKITLVDGADKIVSYTDDDGEHFYPKVFEVNEKGTAVTLLSAYSADTFDVNGYEAFGETALTVDASAVNQDLSIVGNKKNNVILGADGDNTIEGGKGKDTLTGGTGRNTYIFNKGDGQDVITNYKGSDIIKGGEGTTISGGVKGTDVVLSITGGGKVTLAGASKKYIRVTDDTGSHWIGSNTPLKKLTYKDHNVSLHSGYTGDSFVADDFTKDLPGTVFNIDASGVKQDIRVVGNSKANEIVGSKNNDTIEGGKGNDTLTGGDGADVFVWNKGDGNDVITDYNNEDELLVVGDTVKNITKSGKNFVVNLTSKSKITLVGGADKIVSYTDDAGEHFYPKVFEVNEKGTAVTLLSAYSADKFDVNGYEAFGETARTIDASAVDQKLSIVGNAKNNVIIGADGDNTIEGGQGKDTLTGGTGRNTYIFNSGDGSDVIKNYKGSDIIKGGKGTTISGGVKGTDVVLSISGGGKVTLEGASKNYVRVTDDTGSHWIGSNTPLKKLTYKDHNVSLHSGYTGDSFVADDFTKDLPGTVFNIDASGVKHDMTIVGNKQANEITGTNEDDYIEGLGGADKLYGGAGNDSLWGGAGNDMLYGGDGNDTFIYNPGEGKDTIADFTKGDVIMILSGDSYKKEAVSGDDVTFTFSSGSIVVQGAAEKAVKFVDSEGKTIDTYTP